MNRDREQEEREIQEEIEKLKRENPDPTSKEAQKKREAQRDQAKIKENKKIVMVDVNNLQYGETYSFDAKVREDSVFSEDKDRFMHYIAEFESRDGDILKFLLNGKFLRVDADNIKNIKQGYHRDGGKKTRKHRKTRKTRKHRKY